MIYKEFCKICRHGVVDMEKHLKSEEHKRQVRRRLRGEEYRGTKPRLPDKQAGGLDGWA